MKKNVIMKFSASWCQPCKIMKPIFEEISKEEKYKQYNFIEIDIEDENIIDHFDITPNDLCEKYKIRNIPTLIITDEKLNECGKLVGSANKTRIVDFIDNTIIKKGE